MVTEGKLDFGTWKQIFYGEFDGCWKKRVLVKIIGEQERTEDRENDKKGIYTAQSSLSLI